MKRTHEGVRVQCDLAYGYKSFVESLKFYVNIASRGMHN